MKQNQNQQAYSFAVGTSSTNYPHIDIRDPTTNDVQFVTAGIGKIWINNSSSTLPKYWYAASYSSTGGTLLANWVPLSQSALGDIVSLTGDNNTNVYPATDGHVKIQGTSGQITVTEDAANNKLVLALAGGGTAIDSIQVDAATAPGTNPVAPTAAGLVTMTGAQVATGTVGANVIRTDSLAANTLTIEVQRSTAVAATDSTKNGVSHFKSSDFSVDSSGFVSASSTGILKTLTGTTGGALSPTANNINILAASTAAGTTPIAVAGAASTLTINVQKSQAIASTDATKIGLAAFDSAKFTVDANGFVSTVAATVTIVRQVFTSSGTYTPTAGMDYCDIEVVGGGGGSGGCQTTPASTVCASGGGGGGGYARGIFSAASIGVSQTVTIGAAGAAGAVGNNAGGTGGTTSVGALISATGGTGGSGGAAGDISITVGGSGGSGSNGNFQTKGTPGGIGVAVTVLGSAQAGGPGGSSFFGGGGDSSSSTATAAQSYGGGGGGGALPPSTGQIAGAVGFAGIVIITEYIS